MYSDKCVKDVMVPINEYPHVKKSATILDALQECREKSREGYRHVLVFDEQSHLVTMLTARDLLRGAESSFFQTTCPPKFEGYCSPGDSSLSTLWEESFLKDCKNKLMKPLNDILHPVSISTVGADDLIMKALYLMLRDDTNAIPVIRDHTIVGVVRLPNILDIILAKCD